MDELLDRMAEVMADRVVAPGPAGGRPHLLDPEIARGFAHLALGVIRNSSRWALVELPEPVERDDAADEVGFTDFPGIGLYVPVVFDEYPGEVQIRAGAWCDEPLNIAESRELAASILAAALLAAATEAEETP